MGKIVSFMHVSLDGFVAGPNGEMDWIHVDDEIFDYAGDRTSQSDTALYGRVTYQMMENYWPAAGDKPNASKHDKEHSSWYNRVQKIVLSKTMKDKGRPNTKFIGNNIPGEIKKRKAETKKEIIIFGSPSASHTLIAENLIDEYWLFINPVLLGKGIPLFKNFNDRIKLKLVFSHTFKSGVVCLHYAI